MWVTVAKNDKAVALDNERLVGGRLMGMKMGRARVGGAESGDDMVSVGDRVVRSTLSVVRSTHLWAAAGV